MKGLCCLVIGLTTVYSTVVYGAGLQEIKTGKVVGYTDGLNVRPTGYMFYHGSPNLDNSMYKIIIKSDSV